MATAAGASEGFDPRLDAVVREAVRPDGPGAAALVVLDGRVLHQGCYGLADLERGIPVAPRTAFDLASVSKQFTAMAVMILARRGVLSFTDDLRAHLPEWPCHLPVLAGPEYRHRIVLPRPEYGPDRPIRLLDLLHHTSGVADYPNVWRGAALDDRLSNEEYLERLAQAPLEFPTGRRAEYSNSNYILLAQVVERAGGKRFAAFMHDEVFGPLGMTNSWIHDAHDLPIAHRARGYKLGEAGRFEESDIPVVLVGHSHLFSCIEDMARWVQALHANRLVTAADFERACTIGRLDTGERHIYGFGWYEEQRNGRAVLVHSGLWYGFHNYAYQALPEKLAVVVLTNNESFDGEGLVDRLAEVCLRS
jgi:CubicO group peptidase (beta-lactamase class C family)